MIVELPAEIPVTTPPFVIVATPVLEDVHGFVTLGVAEPDRVVLPFTHALKVPVIEGNAVTVTVAV